MRYSFILLGGLFGFLLSRAGATTYDYYAKLFLFQDMQLLWVMGAAAVTGAIGIAAFKRAKTKSLISREPIDFTPKPYKKGLIAGSLLFGLGWGLAGACPGTALAMLGEGKLLAGFTVIGILLGTYIYGVVHGGASSPSPDANSPTPVGGDGAATAA
jgi:uncharacterized protein